MLFTTLGILGMKAGELLALKSAIKLGGTFIGSAVIAGHNVKTARKVEKKLVEIKEGYRDTKLTTIEDYPLTEEEEEMISMEQDSYILKEQVKSAIFNTTVATSTYVATELINEAIDKKEGESKEEAILRFAASTLIPRPLGRI